MVGGDFDCPLGTGEDFVGEKELVREPPASKRVDPVVLSFHMIVEDGAGYWRLTWVVVGQDVGVGVFGDERRNHFCIASRLV